ncbi:MAG TPA: nucleotidyltransferase domain-containing protein [Candidatus Limnocylindria bacterium]
MRYGPSLRAARTRAGLSQAALARLAHTSQSAVARYETGVATPSLSTLERLLAATGGSLVIGRTRGRADPAERLRRSRTELAAAGRARGVGSIRVFGSAARGTATLASDIDLLVELESDRTLIDLIGFKQDAERILGQRVDVATPGLMKRPIRQRALRDARPL